MADSRNGGDGKNKGGGNDSGYDINTDDFVKRLKLFYKCWADEKAELWGRADAVAVVTPPRAEASELRYLKSSALNIWMLGYEFPDTLMVFVKGALHFLCSQKKVKILEELKRPAKSCGIDVVLHVKLRSEDGGSQMAEILDTIKGQSRSPVVGVLSKEKSEGSFMEKWDDVLSSSRLDKVDVAAGFCELFAVKDENEISNLKKAAFLSATAMRAFVVPKLEHVIDEEKRMTHAELMEETENAMLDPPGKLKMKLKAEGADVCYPPIFQSGGVFDLKASAQSNEDPLYYDATAVIICALGGRYNMYCSNVARTYLVDADSSQEKAYKALFKAQEAAINALRPGNLMSAVYKAAATTLEREAPELTSFLTRSAGAGIGIEYRESGLSLNPRNEKAIKAGMVFNVNLGLQNLELKGDNPKTRTYGILLADTVVVRDKGGPEVLTSLSTKAFQDIAYTFKDDDEEPEEKPRSKPASNGAEPLFMKTALRSDNQEMTKEDQRRQNQAELALKKNEETARRLAAGAFGHGENQNIVKSSGEITAYRNVDDLPPSREVMLQVDQKNEAVLVPIYGVMVPFHIATVKTINTHQELSSSIIRIIFNVPGAGFSQNDIPSQKFPHMIYLKELSYRTTDVKHSTQVVQMMKNLKRQVTQRESEKAERATLVTQEKLQISRGKAIRLSDLWIRPPFAGRKRRPGTLEAHVNGFRYSTMKAEETVDILYRNIKHAFFQPAEKEMITLLHFHLHNHIMVGNKKAKDVQFFVEVMDSVQTLGGNRRSHFDPDEIEEEQAERERKNKLNKEFDVFVKKVVDLWEQPALRNFNLDFDIPFRELGFHGVPNKTSAFIVPTVKCLVELIEFPFLVVTMEDIEIVNLERVGFAQKAFDMAIVFKDFKKDVLRIDAIPSTSLDGIKEWLNSMGIKYYESRMNLNWRLILKTILDDPKKFIEDNGWEFLNMEASDDSESEKSEESDKGYEPSDLEEPSESENGDSDNESVVESEDDEAGEEDSDEEEGMSWDELEAKASKEDKEKGAESDSENERRRRKAKITGKARASPKAPPGKRFKR